MKNKGWSSQWLLIAGICLLSLVGWSQKLKPGATSSVAAEIGAVPNRVHYSGTLTDGMGHPLSGIIGVTFSLYKGSQGGVPLWMETQSVQPDTNGRYSVMLGSTTSEGLPLALFASAEARWLGVQVQGYEEQPRVLLLSVPYALKAGDAATIGGLPPSAFVLAAPTSGSSGSPNETSPNISATTVVNGAGTPDFIPLWTSAQFLGSSALFQSGSGSSSMLGINTTTPAATLDVNGGVIARGTLQLPSVGTATASQGFTSQPFAATASVFNGTTQTAVPQTFQWQAEPSGNNTGNTSGTLNLLFAPGSAKPAETGLNIASNGLITFATGQTFPGTGSGTITGVTAGTDLVGGGTSGSVTLNVDTTQVVTGVTAGTDLTGGGTGGVQTLNLDTTKVPQLSSNNSFTGAVGIGAPANPNGWTPLALGSANGFGTWMTLANTSVGGHTWNILSAGAGNAEGAGNLGITDFTGKSAIFLEGNVNATSLTTTGAISGSALTTTGSITGSIVNSNGGFSLGGQPIVTASLNTGNESLGLNAGSVATTGFNNFAAGMNVLSLNTTGSQNTALGEFSLVSNSTGSYNTAVGYNTLSQNTTGTENTAVGLGALGNNTTGSSNTALGWAAGPGSNSTNLNNATAIGAYSQVTESNALVLGSIAGVNGSAVNTLVGIGTTAPSQSLEVDWGNALVRGPSNFQKNGDEAFLLLGDTNNFIQSTFGTGITIGVFQVPNAVRINQYSGFVGIGTTTVTNRLTLGQGTGAAVGDGWNTYSSRRWKTHIHTLDDALAKVEHLRGVSYELKESGKHEIGVIAEEVGQVVPEVVSYEDNGKDARSVDYSRLTALLIEAVKQQQRQIRTQQIQIRAQQQQILQLNNQVGVLQTASHAAQAPQLGDRLRRLELSLKDINSQTTTVTRAEAQK